MKPFTKRLALVMGLLFTALICLGVVYIDSTQNYWYVNSGFVKLIVSNQTQQAIMTVDTNTMRVGFNTNNTTFSFAIFGRQPSNTMTGNGTTAANSGQIKIQSGNGGDAQTNGLTASGGAGGNLNANSGAGGSAFNSASNSTGGAGGSFNYTGGAGGGERAVATNSITGGAGGTVNFVSGPGGIPAFAASNTVGGAGGAINFTASDGATPAAGLITQKPGNGGSIGLTAGNGGNAFATNGGNGGAVAIAAGSATAGQSAAPGIGGTVTITAGAGATGTTNSDGGNMYLVGGVAGSGAVPGYVAIGRAATGIARGGLQVGPVVAGTTAILTNLLSLTAVLDFPSLAAGTVADLPVAFAGAADGDVVSLGVPIASVTNCTWMAFASNAVVYVRAANGQLVTAQDPGSGTFRIKVEKFR